MPTIVVGGHSRNIGKTSVAAGLISALREQNWTAFKVTQFGNAICARDGGDCNCATANHAAVVSEELDRSGAHDSSRLLAAGAERCYWVRARQGYIAEAMPRIRQLMTGRTHILFESNSIVRFVRPDLYLVVLDPAVADFKESTRVYLDRADALLVREDHVMQGWSGVSGRLLASKPVLPLRVPGYVTPEVVGFVRARLNLAGTDALPLSSTPAV